MVDPQGPHPSGARCQLQWWQKFSKNWHFMMTKYSLYTAMYGFNFNERTAPQNVDFEQVSTIDNRPAGSPSIRSKMSTTMGAKNFEKLAFYDDRI